MDKQHLDLLIESEVKPLTKQQVKLLNDTVDGQWEYKDGFVNINGNIWIHSKNLTSIPMKFGIVTGHFSCYDNQITSLKDSPYEVGGNFNINNNQISSFAYMPKKIGNCFYCERNQITSFEHIVPDIKFMFCKYNPFVLNDKLFEDLAKLGDCIGNFVILSEEIEKQIPIQFGITNKKLIAKIWDSYMQIFWANRKD